ncbi:unnamed protein product [Vicia faba]|uniref:No apical meristem-associated C-terminal domain-containing protein n=1 Tax=Vicia faba TaxID=3906 RepID=A0AAV0YUH4_VICFA|nr:unnamed protein product [Vicia faba]
MSMPSNKWHGSKFVGCYKQAVNGKKSGTSKNDIMASAHAFFAQDQGTTFNLEYAWRLLKDEPKWMGESIGSSSKITKTSASGASSENPDTHSSYEFNSSSPMERPMGQKAAKRKGKTNNISTATEDARNKRTTAMERLAQCKEDEIEVKDLIEEEFMDDSDEEQQLQNERQSGSSSRPKRRTTID